MNKYSKLILATILLLSSVNSKAEVTPNSSKQYAMQLSYDPKMSAFAGADMSMSLIEGYRLFDQTIFGSSRGIITSVLGFVSNLLVAETIDTFQHEVFGHGARLREFNWKVVEYKVRLGGGGYAAFIPKPNRPEERILITLGGVQGSEILANKIKNRAFEAGKMNSVYGMNFLLINLDQANYISSLKKGKNSLGHDMASYVSEMNKIYGSGFMTREKLRKASILDYLDPMNIYAAASAITNIDIPVMMIPLGGGIKYLPALRSTLTPYGIESKLMNYIHIGDSFWQLNLSHGKNSYHKSYSIDLSSNNIYSEDRMSLGFTSSIWNQPKLFTSDPKKAKNQYGGLLAANTSYYLSNNFSVTSEIGYKTSGFLVGRPAKSSPLLRLGIKAEF